MKIIGIDGLDVAQIQNEVERGGRFVMYQYCISILVMTFKRPTNIYFIHPGESAGLKGLPFTLLSLVLGWWGFPWGPIYTIGSIWNNSKGGIDVTASVMTSLKS